MFTAPLNNLIAGWKEGLPYIGEGGKIKLVIPSHLAYNNGVLVFDVTLHYIQ
jgi:FKBP-type peptidyl-prolyl cis-trans isomerase FkpA